VTLTAFDVFSNLSWTQACQALCIQQHMIGNVFIRRF